MPWILLLPKEICISEAFLVGEKKKMGSKFLLNPREMRSPHATRVKLLLMKVESGATLLGKAFKRGEWDCGTGDANFPIRKG
jgi:hypothetical protein